MRKTDINNYSGDRGGSSVSVGSVIKEFFAIIGKILATAFLVTLFTGLVVGVSLLLYVVGIANEPNTINLDDLRLIFQKIKTDLAPFAVVVCPIRVDCGGVFFVFLLL